MGYLRAVLEAQSLLAVCAALDVEDPILQGFRPIEGSIWF